MAGQRPARRERPTGPGPALRRLARAGPFPARRALVRGLWGTLNEALLSFGLVTDHRKRGTRQGGFSPNMHMRLLLDLSKARGSSSNPLPLRAYHENNTQAGILQLSQGAQNCVVKNPAPGTNGRVVSLTKLGNALGAQSVAGIQLAVSHVKVTVASTLPSASRS